MKRSFQICLLAATVLAVGTAFAQESQTSETSSAISVAARKREAAGTMPTPRHAGAVEHSKRLPLPEDSIVIHIDGTGVADSLSVTRNGEAVMHKEAIELPADVELEFASQAGDVIGFSAVQGKASARGVHVMGASSTTIYDRLINVNIRFFVPYRGVLAEVLTNSGTGGRFEARSSYCSLSWIPVYACPSGYVVGFITDRAERGESILTVLTDLFTPGRVEFASSVGINVNDAPRIVVPGIGLPAAVPQRVSVNPNDDNIVAFAVLNGVYNSRRVPVGTRP